MNSHTIIWAHLSAIEDLSGKWDNAIADIWNIIINLWPLFFLHLFFRYKKGNDSKKRNIANGDVNGKITINRSLLNTIGYYLLIMIWMYIVLFGFLSLFDKYSSSYLQEGNKPLYATVNNEINGNSWSQIEHEFKWIKVQEPIGFTLIDETMVSKSYLAKWNNPLIFARPDGLFFRVNVIEDISRIDNSTLDIETKQLLKTDIIKNSKIDLVRLKEFELNANKLTDVEWGGIQGFTCSREIYTSDNKIDFLMCRYERLKWWETVSYRIVYRTMNNNKLIWATVWIAYEGIQESQRKAMIDEAWTIADSLINWISIPITSKKVNSQKPLLKTNTVSNTIPKPVIQNTEKQIVKDTCDIAINSLTESHSNNGWMPISDYSYCLSLADKDRSVNKQPSKPCHKLCEKYRSRQYIHDKKCAMWDPYEKCD